MILWLEIRNGKRSYLSSDGAAVARPPRKALVMLSLKDCQVVSLDVPGTQARNRRVIIENLLPRRYPGLLDGMLWDFSYTPEETLVFLARKDLVEEIRKDLGKDAIIQSPGQFIPKTEKSRKIFSCVSPLGYDLFFFFQNKLEHTVHLDKYQGLQKQALISEFASQYGEKTDAPPTEDPLSPDRPQKNLFSVKSRRTYFPFAAAGIFCLLLILAILAGFFREKSVLAKRLAAAEETYREMENAFSRVSLQEKERELEENLDRLIALAPRDVYGILEALFEPFSRRGEILNFTCQGDTLQIRGQSRNSLRLMEELKAQGIFAELNLNQIQRDAGSGMEIFTFSGKLP